MNSTSNKGNATQIEMEMFALQIGINSSNTENTCATVRWEKTPPLSDINAGSVNCSALLESSLADISRTLKMFLLCDPGGQFLGIYPEEVTTAVQNIYGQELSLQRYLE